jgi:Na+/alanine symporter
MIKSLKNMAVLLLVAVAVLSVSCKSKEVCYLKFPVTAAFVGTLGDFSGYVLTFLILSFAYATIICWYFYGSEICRHRGFAFVFVIFLLLPMVARMDFIIYSTDLIILFMAIIVLSRIIKGRDRIALLSHECLNKSDS